MKLCIINGVELHSNTVGKYECMYMDILEGGVLVITTFQKVLGANFG
jgi:hypothetical protein